MTLEILDGSATAPQEVLDKIRALPPSSTTVMRNMARCQVEARTPSENDGATAPSASSSPQIVIESLLVDIEVPDRTGAKPASLPILAALRKLTETPGLEAISGPTLVGQDGEPMSLVIGNSCPRPSGSAADSADISSLTFEMLPRMLENTGFEMSVEMRRKQCGESADRRLFAVKSVVPQGQSMLLVFADASGAAPTKQALLVSPRIRREGDAFSAEARR